MGNLCNFVVVDHPIGEVNNLEIVKGLVQLVQVFEDV